MLVLRGEPGVGKTALLDYLARQAGGCQVARAAGVQSEMELAFAGLHQLCAPMLDRLGPAAGAAAGGAADRVRPERRAAAGPVPGRAGRAEPAVGGGRGAAADLRDRRRAVAGPGLGAGAGVRGAAAGRRPGRAGVRGPDPGAELAGLPELDGGRAARGRRAGAAGLGAGRAAGRAGAGPDRGRDAGEPAGAAGAAARADARPQLAGGFGLPGAAPLPGRIEESFRRQLEALPAPTRGCCCWRRPTRPATRR